MSAHMLRQSFLRQILLLVAAGVAWSCVVDERDLTVRLGDGDGDGTGGFLPLGDGDGDGDGGGTGGTGPTMGSVGGSPFPFGTGGEPSVAPTACDLNPFLVHDMETDWTCFGGGMITVHSVGGASSIWPDTQKDGYFTYTPLEPWDLPALDPTYPGNAAHFHGEGPFQDFSPSLDLIFQWSDFVDLRDYSGLSFFLRSDACYDCTLRISLQTSSVRPINSEFPPAGHCDEGIEECWRSHGVDVTVTEGVWQPVVIDFNVFEADEWPSQDLLLDEVHSLSITYAYPPLEALEKIDIWLDQVMLF